MDNVLVTGADGFVGKALVRWLAGQGRPIRGAVRGPSLKTASLGLDDLAVVGDIGTGANWRPVLKNVGVIVHLAARAHVMKDSVEDPLAEFRRVNTRGTAVLARAAAESHVRRLIYVSTIKVNGECTPLHAPFKADDPPNPSDPYGISKYEAEQALWETARDSGLEVVVVRPPLVYGPEVKGNFHRLLSLVARGVPLPLGRVDNRRSLIGLGNLVDFIGHCLDHPKAAGETFLVSDGFDLSTSEMVKMIAHGLDREPRLVNVPLGILRLAARTAGKTRELNRLCDSLVVDASHARHLLGWTPPVPVEAGFKETVRWFLENHVHESRTASPCG